MAVTLERLGSPDSPMPAISGTHATLGDIDSRPQLGKVRSKKNYRNPNALLAVLPTL